MGAELGDRALGAYWGRRERPSGQDLHVAGTALSPPSLSDVQRSAMGLLFWVIVLTTWVTIFQTHRARWGELGDYLSFTIPLGIP